MKRYTEQSTLKKYKVKGKMSWNSFAKLSYQYSRRTRMTRKIYEIFL